MTGQGTATPGGARLRALRERAGRAQLWVEAEAALGTGYLQRVESGRVAQPGRATLVRVLDALDARHGERRDVLALFGYRVATPLPTAADCAWARETCRHQLHEVPFPAYALDCATRLIAWNGQFARLLAAAPGRPAPGALTTRPLLAAWFDPAAPLAALVAEPDTLLPALIRALRYEILHLRDEEWYGPWFAALGALPRFRDTWARVAAEAEPASAARALVPVRLRLPQHGPCQFRLATEPFLRDARFRLVYLFPADTATLHRCAAWAEE